MASANPNKWTVRSLAAITPRPTKRLEHADPDNRGLLLRVEPGKPIRGQFFYRYRLDGKLRMVKLGRFPETPLTAARKAYRAAVAQRDQGKDVQDERQLRRQQTREALNKQRIDAKDRKLTLNRVFREYMAAEGPKLASGGERVRSYVMQVRPLIGHKPASSITPDDIRLVLKPLRRQGKDTTANRLRAYLSRLFSWAADIEGGGYVHLTNPVAPTRRTKEDPREREVSGAELRLFLRWLEAAELRPVVKSAVRLALFTGKRRGELVLAKHVHIDLEEGKWHLPGSNTKNGKADVVMLSKQAKKILKGQRLMTDEHVFESTRILGKALDKEALTKAVTQFCKESGVEDLHLHDFRSALTTWAAEAFPKYMLDERLLNHRKNGTAGKHYNFARFNAPAAEVLQAWADYLDALVAENVTPIRRRKRA